MSERAGPPEFSISVADRGSRAVIGVRGELDLATAGDLDARVREQLAAGPVLLDLGELSFMDSSGVRLLDGLLRDAEREGWTLAIGPGLTRGVRQVLEMTGMLDRLPFDGEPSSDGAV